MQKAKGRIKNLVIVAVVFLPALCFGQNLDSLRIDLFKSRYGAGNDYQGYHRDDSYKALNQLLSIGSNQAIDILEYYLTTYGANRDLKSFILAGLGKLGTERSIKAVDEFRVWAKDNNFNNNDFYFGFRDHACGGNSARQFLPIVKCKDEAGSTWAVFIWERYGISSLWLTSSTNGVNWSEPILIDPPQLYETSQIFIKEYYKTNHTRSFSTCRDTSLFYELPGTKCKIKCEGGMFTLTFNKQSINFTVPVLNLDSDDDGLPDAVELLLKTNPKVKDSDGDGVLDSKDCNPLTLINNKVNDTTEIKQAVFYNEMATSNSKDGILIRENNENDSQEYYGYGSYILRSNSTTKGFTKVGFYNIKIDSDSAKIYFSTSDCGGRSREVKLRKINYKWYVIGYGICVMSSG